MMKVSIVNFDTQYLAHPAELRDEARTIQERLEQLGVTVVNPFEREGGDPLKSLRHMHSPEDYNHVVERDLKWIRGCDSVFAYVPQERAYGAMMEIFYAAKVLDKPVFIFTKKRWQNHPWLNSCGMVFSDLDFMMEVLEMRQRLDGYLFHFCLGGKMGSGKSTTSNFLEKAFQFRRYSFASKLKAIATDLFGMEQKDRELLQVLGTKLRDIDRDVWVEAVLHQIKADQPNRVVIDDMRYVNESAIMKEHFYDLIKLECPDETRNQRGVVGLNAGTVQHPSELEIDLIHADYTIRTDCPVEELYRRTMKVLLDIAHL